MRSGGLRKSVDLFRQAANLARLCRTKLGQDPQPCWRRDRPVGDAIPGHGAEREGAATGGDHAAPSRDDLRGQLVYLRPFEVAFYQAPRREPVTPILAFVVGQMRAGATVDDFDWREIERQVAKHFERVPLRHAAQDGSAAAPVTGNHKGNFP